MPVLLVPSITQATSTYGNGASMFDTEATTNTTASSSLILTPPGFYFVVTAAQNTVQYTPDGGTTLRTLVPASSAGMIYADGASVQIANTTTGGTSAHYARVRGNV